MKHFIYDLLGEGGKLSTMRVMAMICCMSACYLALSKGPDELTVISALLGAAMAGKSLQKISEVKSQNGQQ